MKACHVRDRSRTRTSRRCSTSLAKCCGGAAGRSVRSRPAIGSTCCGRPWTGRSAGSGGRSRLSILPSGRLGMPHEGPFYTGQTTYLGVMAQVELEHATRTFSKHWDSAAATPDEWEGSALDHAAKFEFGFTLTELTTLCVEIGA